MNGIINTQTLPIFDSKLYSTAKKADVDDSFSTFVCISLLDVYASQMNFTTPSILV